MAQIKMRLVLSLILFSLGCQAAVISITWDPSTGATGYRLYQSVGTAPFTLLNTFVNTTASVSVVTNDQTRFYVTATNSGGESEPSNIYTNAPAVMLPPTPP